MIKHIETERIPLYARDVMVMMASASSTTRILLQIPMSLFPLIIIRIEAVEDGGGGGWDCVVVGDVTLVARSPV